MKWGLSVAIIVQFGLIAPGSVIGQEEMQERRNPMAVRAFIRAISALGGSTRLANISTAVVTGTIEPAPDSWLEACTFTWKEQFTENRPMFRKEMRTAQLSQVLLSNHGNPALLRGGEVIRLGTHMTFAVPPLHLPIVVLARQVDDPRYNLGTPESASVRGTATMRLIAGIEGDSDESTQHTWYFDVVTGVPLRVEYRVPSAFDRHTFQIGAAEFADFRLVGGILVPFRIVLSQEDKQIGTVTLSSVTFNGVLDPTEFEVPAGGGQ